MLDALTRLSITTSISKEITRYKLKIMIVIKKNFLITLLIVSILFGAFDSQADETADVICNVISYIRGLGGPLFTVVIIGASLLAIFGGMPWPALFSLGMFIAVFFGASKIVTTITGKEACCLYEGQMIRNGKCSGDQPTGPSVRPDCPGDFVRDNDGDCVDPSMV